MEPFEKEELTETDLDQLLESWTAPQAPPQLRAAIFSKASVPWWKQLWIGSIRLPIPIASVLLAALTAVVWRGIDSPPSQIVIRRERVEVPVVQERVVTKVVTKYLDRKEPSGFDIHGLRPVAELRPRIIRSGNGKN